MVFPSLCSPQRRRLASQPNFRLSLSAFTLSYSDSVVSNTFMYCNTPFSRNHSDLDDTSERENGGLFARCTHWLELLARVERCSTEGQSRRREECTGHRRERRATYRDGTERLRNWWTKEGKYWRRTWTEFWVEVDWVEPRSSRVYRGFRLLLRILGMNRNHTLCPAHSHLQILRTGFSCESRQTSSKRSGCRTCWGGRCRGTKGSSERSWLRLNQFDVEHANPWALPKICDWLRSHDRTALEWRELLRCRRWAPHCRMPKRRREKCQLSPHCATWLPWNATGDEGTEELTRRSDQVGVIWKRLVDLDSSLWDDTWNRFYRCERTSFSISCWLSELYMELERQHVAHISWLIRFPTYPLPTFFDRFRCRQHKSPPLVCPLPLACWVVHYVWEPLQEAKVRKPSELHSFGYRKGNELTLFDCFCAVALLAVDLVFPGIWSRAGGEEGRGEREGEGAGAGRRDRADASLLPEYSAANSPVC